MTITAILMLLSVAVAGCGFWRAREPAVTLAARLALARAQALAWGVVILSSMMPAVRCGRARYGPAHPLALPIVLALDAGQCLATVFVRSYLMDRIRTEWHARVWRTVVGSDVV